MATDDTVSLHQLLVVLRRRRWVLIQTLLVGTVAGVLFSLRTPTEYQASATLLVEPEPSLLPVALFGTIQRTTGTVSQLVTTREIADRVATSLGTEESPEALLGRVETEADQQDAFVVVTASGDTPGEAVQLTNAFADEFVESRSESAKERLRTAVDAIERQLSSLPKDTLARDALTTQLAQLRVLPTLPTADVKVADRSAAAVKASGPRPLRDGVIGLGLGLLLGLVIVSALEAFNRRLKSVAELHRRLPVPHLASVTPSVFVPRRRRKAGPGPAAAEIEPEPFERLRTSLLVLKGKRALKSVLVTSPFDEREGKTLVAASLAASLAKTGLDVCVVDADLRRPGLADEFGADGAAPGLSDLITSDRLEEVAQRVKVADGEILASGNGSRPDSVEVTLIPAGQKRANPAELLASARMEELLRDLETRHDAVIVDCAPVLAASDAIPLAARASGTLLVVRLAHTPVAAAVSAVEVIERAEGDILGVVATGVPKRAVHEEGYGPRPLAAPKAFDAR